MARTWVFGLGLGIRASWLGFFTNPKDFPGEGNIVLVLTLKNVWKDGTRAFLLEPDDLLVRLCAAVPTPPPHVKNPVHS